MARLTILEYPDPRLRTVAAPVTAFDADLQTLIDDMFETMYAAPGVGLAATQVDQHIRLVVADCSEHQDSPLVFINPELLSKEGLSPLEEGCLSIPKFYENTGRAEKVRVRALDRKGKPFELEADGLLSVCIQHEMDHLDGKLFVDYLSELKRGRIRSKLEKSRRARAL
jgi:peptide deformylase